MMMWMCVGHHQPSGSGIGLVLPTHNLTHYRKRLCGGDGLSSTPEICQINNKSEPVPDGEQVRICLFGWRLLDSNQWPHACEYSMREAVTCFPLRPALLDPDFMVLGCCLVHRLRTVFSCSGSDKSTIRKASHGIQAGAQIYVLALSFLMTAKTSEKFSQ